MWLTWQLSVPLSGLTCSDQRQPGSNVPRPIMFPFRSTSSTLPLPSLNSRTSSGEPNALPVISAIAPPLPFFRWVTRRRSLTPPTLWRRGTGARARPNTHNGGRGRVDRSERPAGRGSAHEAPARGRRPARARAARRRNRHLVLLLGAGVAPSTALARPATRGREPCHRRTHPRFGAGRGPARRLVRRQPRQPRRHLPRRGGLLRRRGVGARRAGLDERQRARPRDHACRLRRRLDETALLPLAAPRAPLLEPALARRGAALSVPGSRVFAHAECRRPAVRRGHAGDRTFPRCLTYSYIGI